MAKFRGVSSGIDPDFDDVGRRKGERPRTPKRRLCLRCGRGFLGKTGRGRCPFCRRGLPDTAAHPLQDVLRKHCRMARMLARDRGHDLTAFVVMNVYDTSATARCRQCQAWVQVNVEASILAAPMFGPGLAVNCGR